MRAPEPSRLDRMPGLAGKVLRRLRGYWWVIWPNKHHVFTHRGPYSAVTDTELSFRAYENADDLPAEVCHAIIAEGGESTLAEDRRELRENATLYVASINDRSAGLLLTRKGRYFAEWFVPLDSEDVVFFRVRTYPAFRGRGVAPKLYRFAMHAELANGGTAYVDCSRRNVPSIRSILRAGFEWIADEKPLSRKRALAVADGN